MVDPERSQRFSRSASLQNALIVRANAHRILGRFELSVSDYTSAMKANNGDNLINELGGRSLAYIGLKRFSDAFSDANRAVEIVQKYDRLKSFKAEAFNIRAWVKYRTSQCDSALNDINQALNSDPEAEEIANLYDTRSAIYLCLNKAVDAVRDLDAAINLDPYHSIYFLRRGLARDIVGDSGGAAADHQRADKIGNSTVRHVEELAELKERLTTVPPADGMSRLVGRWVNDKSGETLEVKKETFGVEATLSNVGRVGVSLTSRYSSNIQLSGRTFDCFYYVSFNSGSRSNFSFVKGEEVCPRGIFTRAE